MIYFWGFQILCLNIVVANVMSPAVFEAWYNGLSQQLQRKFSVVSPNVGESIYNYLGGYGCWCFFEENGDFSTNHDHVPVHDHDWIRGKGKPVDAFDEACQQLYYSYTCAAIELENSGDDSCIPWEVDYEKPDFDIDFDSFDWELGILASCQIANPNSECASLACMAEGVFINTLLDLLMSFPDLQSRNTDYLHEYKDKKKFDYESLCNNHVHFTDYLSCDVGCESHEDITERIEAKKIFDAYNLPLSFDAYASDFTNDILTELPHFIGQGTLNFTLEFEIKILAGAHLYLCENDWPCIKIHIIAPFDSLDNGYVLEISAEADIGLDFIYQEFYIDDLLDANNYKAFKLVFPPDGRFKIYKTSSETTAEINQLPRNEDGSLVDDTYVINYEETPINEVYINGVPCNNCIAVPNDSIDRNLGENSASSLGISSIDKIKFAFAHSPFIFGHDHRDDDHDIIGHWNFKIRNADASDVNAVTDTDTTVSSVNSSVNNAVNDNIGSSNIIGSSNNNIARPNSANGANSKPNTGSSSTTSNANTAHIQIPTKACCGEWPSKYPYSTERNRSCCGASTYNASKLRCCKVPSAPYGVAIKTHCNL